MRLRAFIDQLAKRRVFRAAAIYVASVWVLVQAADVFAGENIIPTEWVSGLIFVAAIGFPLVLAGSWFLEAPWKARSRIATAGDLFIIVAITLGALLFAWQQWAVSRTHIAIAVGRVAATDLQEDTAALAEHLEKRFGLLLDASTEADLVVEGTLVRSGDMLRLTMRVVDPAGQLLWSETFNEALVDVGSLQLAFVETLAVEVRSLEKRVPAAERIIVSCPYPANSDAIIALVDGREPELLSGHIEENTNNGLLYLRQAEGWFEAVNEAPPHQKSVLYALAQQSLDRAKAACPAYAELRPNLFRADMYLQ